VRQQATQVVLVTKAHQGVAQLCYARVGQGCVRVENGVVSGFGHGYKFGLRQNYGGIVSAALQGVHAYIQLIVHESGR